MKNKYLKNILGLTIALLTLAGCDEDDIQNASTMGPTDPTGSVSLDFSNPTTLLEGNENFDFTVSLSETQIVDVKVYLSQTGGTATEGEDFTFPSSILIPANTLSATGTISILEDELAEDAETVVITIGSGNKTANAAFTSTTVTINILNLISGDLAASLAWEASEPVFDSSGNEISPTDIADLRFLLTDVPYTTIVDAADGGSFETLVISESTPDGEYYLVADFFAADEDVSTDLDLEVELSQLGINDGKTYNFPAALNTDLTCSASFAILLKLTKTGGVYVVEEIGQTVTQVVLADFVGTWTGTDVFGYDTQVVTSLDGSGQLQITGLGFEWMLESWGEIITNSVSLPMIVDLETGKFTVDEAYFLSTTFLGAVQPDYNLSATGSLNPCTGGMSVVYDFIQGGTSCTAAGIEDVFSEDILLP